MNLSATILVHNSAKTIEKCLKSLESLVSEVVIIDDHSTDNTVELIKQVRPDAKVFERRLDNDFAAQRNYSMAQCSHEWVIIIDSDEVISEELGQSIKQVISSEPKQLAYCCVRMNENITGWQRELLKRPVVMKKDLLWKDSIHETIDAPLGLLEGKLFHHAWDGMSDFMHELNKYTTWKAEAWIKQGRNYSLPWLVVRQVMNFKYRFLQRLIGEKRFLKGWTGFLYCLAWASEELFVGLKFIEMKKAEKK